MLRGQEALHKLVEDICFAVPAVLYCLREVLLKDALGFFRFVLTSCRYADADDLANQAAHPTTQ
ncbi:hypothetical protein XI03_20865 [Bradyrhizobium sp. CCBAU 65884]|nr:hypothetical protein [Bradyrhizobium sp. CCBAU 65884]